MTSEWKSKLWVLSTALAVGIVSAMVTVKLSSKAEASYNDEMSYKEKIEQLDKGKLDKPEFKECKNEIYTRIDGVEDNMKEQLDGKVDQKVFDLFLKNQDIFIQNQIAIQKTLMNSKIVTQ